MNRIKGIFLTGACLTVSLCLAPQNLAQKKPEGKEASTDATKAFRVREGFQGPLTLKTKAGKSVALKVSVRTWSIDGTLGRQTIKTSDFTLFQMRGGKIKAYIDGKEEIKGADMFWTLPAGATFTFEVKGETALLDAMTISTK
jgi:hypothetical protein